MKKSNTAILLILRDYLIPNRVTAGVVEVQAKDCVKGNLPDSSATQPPQDERCPTCGENEPHTGTCGTSDDDTRAFCKRHPAGPEQPVALSTLTDAQIEQIWLNARDDKNELKAAIYFARAILAASAPAQQATLHKWAALQESDGTPWQEGYAAARRYVAMQLATPPQPVAAEVAKQARFEALEEAARLVENYDTHGDVVGGWQNIFAIRIRALAGTGSNESTKENGNGL